jgi:hypothetical protein
MCGEFPHGSCMGGGRSLIVTPMMVLLTILLLTVALVDLGFRIQHRHPGPSRRQLTVRLVYGGLEIHASVKVSREGCGGELRPSAAESDECDPFTGTR